MVLVVVLLVGSIVLIAVMIGLISDLMIIFAIAMRIRSVSVG